LASAWFLASAWLSANAWFSGFLNLARIYPRPRVSAMNKVWLRFCGVCLGLGVSFTDAGAQTTPSLQLTLQDALRLSAESDPRLQGQVFVRQGAEARRAQAQQRPVTTLATDIENVLGTGGLGTFNDAELTLSLGTTLELGNKRGKRIDLADREKEKLEIELQNARLDTLADVARHFIAVLQAQEALTVARDGKALAARIQQIVATRVASGVALPVERSNAEVATIQKELTKKAAASALRAAWARLVVSWGGAPDSAGQAAGNLFGATPMPAFAGLQEMVERNPEILRLASERRVRDAALRMAESQATPDVAVSAGVRRFEAGNDQAFVFSASVPLGVAGRAGPARDEARSRLNMLEAEEKARRNELLGTLYGLRQRAETARDSLSLLDSGALPAAVRAQEQAEAAFRAGRSSLLELTATQRQLLDLRRDKIETAATYHLLVIDIERLMGLPLAAASGSP